MRTIDFVSVFLLLGSAPFWQIGLDHLCPGLGSSLLILLLIGATKTALEDCTVKRTHPVTTEL